MEPQDRYRIVVLSNGVVGKTAIVIQYCQSHFVSTWDPNIEDTHTKETVVDGKKCCLDILDASGPEEDGAMRDQWIASASGVFLVFSFGSRSSFSALEKMLVDIRQKRPDNPPIILLGNKCDLPQGEQEIATEEAVSLAAQHGIMYMPCSAKNATNITECFSEMVRKLRSAQVESQPEPTDEDRKRAKKCIVQ